MTILCLWYGLDDCADQWTLEGRPVDIPTYDYAEHTRSSKTYRQEPQDVFIVEGILVLEDKRLRDLMDIKIFVDTDDDVRIIRRIKRDMEERGRSLDSVIEQYLGVVKPMYHQFIEPTKRYADVIIPEGVTNTVAIDLITTKIEKSSTKRVRENKKREKKGNWSPSVYG